MPDSNIGTDDALVSGSYVRPRINSLLTQAIKKPLTIVCAGMGCGKTRAVYDFVQQCGLPFAWFQLSDSDNIGSRFWEICIRGIAQISKTVAEEYKKLGFPDSEDRINKFINIDALHSSRYIFVLDDTHLIHDVTVLRFLERVINNIPEKHSVILISRKMPLINISGLMIRNRVSIISESDLNFTKIELNQYLLLQGLGAETTNLQKIYADTKGWAFIISFLAWILKRSPGYAGYAQSAVKQDILQLLEMEAWSVISSKLRRLLLQLSLTDHRSAGLVGILAEGDESLIFELKQQNAFIRFDRLIDSYYVHHLFLEFLHTKQDILAEDDIKKTYKTIADWCLNNDFIVDALFYYEKIADYQSIVTVLFTSHVVFVRSVAQHIAGIFDNAPPEIFDSVDFSAAMHVHLTMCLGKWQEALNLLKYYEEKYLRLPEENAFRNRMLSCIYYYWGVLRMVLCTADDCYDFDRYFAKQCEHLESFPVQPGCWYQHPPSIWTCLVGCARAGAPQEYINALVRSEKYLQSCINGLGAGVVELCQGELLYYQGIISEAELCFIKALERAQENCQHAVVSRALYYIMRCSVFQGDYAKIVSTLKELEGQLTQDEDSVRFFSYDSVIGWYYLVLCQPEMIPGWLKEKFTFYSQSNTIEIAGNSVKVKYSYQTKNYSSLLAYMEEKKQWESILYERVELLALEACVHLKMKNKQAQFKALQEAYEIALPNGLVMPFIELGKDMRVLAEAALSDPECSIPQSWLKSIKKSASAYFRNQSSIISNYKKVYEISGKIVLSPREIAILHDLHDGYSRSDIAAKYGLSVNTVKLHINSIYDKLGARNRVDVYKIAAEHNLL